MIDAGAVPEIPEIDVGAEPDLEIGGEALPTVEETQALPSSPHIVKEPSASGRAAAREAPKPPPAVKAAKKLPFRADTRSDVSSAQQGNPVLVSVTKGSHRGYVRYVFEFANNDPEGHSPLVARPAWDVRYVPRSEAVQDGSGDPVPVGGRERLRIRFEGAAMHWDDGRSSLTRSVPDHDPLVFAGDYEGYVNWFLGLDTQRPFRAFFTDNNKVVIDVVQ